MVVPNTMDPVVWLRKHLDEEGSDLLREMIREFAEQLMSADAQGLCNAGYGEVSDERMNVRNGYRPRELDARVGTIEAAIPKLRRGSYFPQWLLESSPVGGRSRPSPRWCASATSKGVSTRRVDDIVKTLGIEGISRSEVSRLAKTLDAASRPSAAVRWTAGFTPTCGSTP